MLAVMDCGGDELSGAAEHPAVRRIRHRRLLAFLRHQGLERTFRSMVDETNAFFSAAHLQDCMRRGQWRAALGYLWRFVQPEDRRLLSLEAQVLHLFLVAHSCLADILAGTQEMKKAAAFLSKHRKHGSQGILRIHSILLTALHAKQHLVASWEHVRHRAAEIAYDLVLRTPELKGVVLQPAGPTKPNNVLPICSSTGRSYRRKNHLRQPQASALAKRYLRRRESLLSSSHYKESANEAELHAKAATWIADILDESLKAGKHQELHQTHPVQTSESQGTTKHSSQVGSTQDLNPRKNPVDVTASDEHNQYPKRQQTSGAFAEASMPPVIWT